METVIVLFCAWALVTVIGHASWVVVRGFFRLFINTDVPQPTPPPVSDEKADIAASRRVINRLVRYQLMDPSAVGELHQKLRRLEYGDYSTPEEGAAVEAETSDSSEHFEQPILVNESAAAESEEPIVAELAEAPETALLPSETPVRETVAAAVAFDESHLSASDEDSEPSPLSRSEVIQSFLAAHNIRWGELAAGTLIVGCSIGLVITLWNTLVDTHRVVPSLLFLCADAAIYAAGLYTLSRWRLRHTSRAVLVIATLLVPLSVLAGLAATGTGADAVQLSDPITLAAVIVAGLIYLTLLYRGGKALAGRLYAAPIALSVAGPVAILPFVPASVRTLGVDAGWIVTIASIAVLAAALRQLRIHAGRGTSIGPAVARARFWAMGFAGFSLVMSVGYTAYSVREFGLEGFMPIAISVLPALVALSSCARALMRLARVDTHSMIGAVSATMLMLMAWAVMPAAMASPSWLWAWAIVFAFSTFGVGWLARQPRWVALATMPAGTAAVLSSPIWLGGHGWETVALWQRFFGREPMVAAILVTLVVAVASRLISRAPSRRWLGYASVFWALVATTIAAGLSFVAPSQESWIPWWSVTAVLVVGVAVSTFQSARHRYFAFTTIGSVVFVWLSVYHPIQLVPFRLASSEVWITTLLAISAMLLVLSELAPRMVVKTKKQRRCLKQVTPRWLTTSAVTAIVACVFVCPMISSDWVTAAITLACTTTLLFWGSTLSRSIDVLRVSQMATIALLMVVGYGRFSESLFASAAWSSGEAPWSWALLIGVAAGLWMLIRHAATGDMDLLDRRPIRRRLVHLTGRQASMFKMPDGWAAVVSNCMIWLGSLWALASLLFQVAGSQRLEYGFPFIVPVVAFPLCACVSRLASRFDNEWKIAAKWEASLVIAGIFWAACQLARFAPADPSVTLVVATTMAVFVCLALPRWGISWVDRRLADEVNKATIFALPALVAICSGVLLWYGWWIPISNGMYAQTFETLSVAGWWAAASVGLLWVAKRTRDITAAASSATLLPIAAMLVVPVFSYSHFAVWIQVGACVSIAWVAVTRRWFNEDQLWASRRVIDASMWFAVTVGIVTSALVTVRIAFNVQELEPVLGPAGLLISSLTAVLWSIGWVRLPFQESSTSHRLSWPLAVSMLAGQIAWLTEALGYADRATAVELIPAIWLLASLGSLEAYRVRRKQVDFIHVGLVAIATVALSFAVGLQSELIPWFAVAALATAGLMVALVGSGPKLAAPWLGASRLLGWFVVIAGGILLVGRIASGTQPDTQWTLMVTWAAVWVLGWRLARPERKSEEALPNVVWRAVPDREFATGVMIAVLFETILFTLGGQPNYQTEGIADPLLWARVVAYLAVSGSTLLRAGHRYVWTVSMATLAATSSLVAVQIAIHLDATDNQRWMWAVLPPAFTIAFLSHWLTSMARLISWLAGGSVRTHVDSLVSACWQIALMMALLGGFTATAMIMSEAPAAEIQLTIVAIAMAAWSIAEMAEARDSTRLRHAAVNVALAAIGFWATVDTGQTSHPYLSASMRWLVASVFAMPMMLFVFPKLLGQNLASRWNAAFRRGAVKAEIAAACSLVCMLVMEALLRGQDGIEGVPWPLVIGVAVTLAILSLLAGLVGIFSGPGFELRERLQLTDKHRAQLIIAAQVLGAITWVHVVLCRNWTLVELRDYWPYIVMALAFVSVGVTQWARQRKDEVMSQTLSHTALYLPLIPVIGFWMSGWFDDFSWQFAGGRARYDLLLAIGSVYYIAVSALWKGVMPRIAAIVLGNGAWWVVLAQQPGWNFLLHPQVWLIPPAVCVLLAVHLYRDRLNATTSSAVRYAATLVIYISSTADLLIQQIGTNIWGPIVLVSLALVGMACGVVLRIRPFLYLGGLFLFLGVTSMVWHAQKAMDAVWPWWAFGITTGILLLVGLMAIEKNKPKLRRYANNLATWQG